MKAQGILFTLAICAVVVSSLYFTYLPPRIVEERVLIDLTDSLKSRPDASQLFAYYGFSNNPWNGGSFRAKSITDIDYNRAYAVEIAPADFSKRLLANEIERKHNIEEFTAKQEVILDSVMSNTVGREHSSVYRVIAGELNDLSTLNRNHQRILFVYGDIRENSGFLNLYEPSQVALLKNDPDSIMRLFHNQARLQDLSGIEIYFIYQPPSYADDEPYRLISEVYKRMLEEKGAVVTIAANLVI